MALLRQCDRCKRIQKNSLTMLLRVTIDERGNDETQIELCAHCADDFKGFHENKYPVSSRSNT